MLINTLQGVPLQCSAFITRHSKLLTEANSLNAEYLFQNDKYYDASYDSGDKSIQCGRKVDSLKLWLAIAGRGVLDLQASVDRMFEVASYVTNKLKNHENFELVIPQFQGNTICFWYVPKELRPLSSSNGIEGIDKERLHKVCPAIKAAMMKEGKLMVNYQPLTSKGLPNFFRLVLTCMPLPTTQDMDEFVEAISRLASNISF